MRKQVIISILTLVALNTIPLCISTSALSSQNNTNIEFTLNPTLSLSLSGSLSLLGLQPGTSADSNVITIDIGTNNVTGYTLSANVGNNDYAHGGTNYNANDLVFTNGALIPSPTTTNKFTSLSTTDSYPTLDNESIVDNTWGYSYMVSSSDSDSSSNNTWSNYSGLPAYTSTSSKTIYETTTSSHDSIKFKLGARAASNQVAGTYTNVVNFMAVTNAVPMSISDAFALAGAEQVNGYYTMQDMTSSICEAVQVYDEDSQTQLIDVRDHKVYWVAKLRDNHCWMTQNLDLDLDSTVALTSEDTDLNEFGANNYDVDNGYSCSDPNTTAGCAAEGEIISWLPERRTINAIGGTITGWVINNYEPYSVDVGNWYKTYEYFTSNKCYINNNNRYCDYLAGLDDYDKYFSQAPYPGNGAHGHVGNYYNWSAAIASNDSSVYTASTYDDSSNNPRNSICPTNWRLPQQSSNRNEFYNMLMAEDAYATTGNERDKAVMSAPLYFIRSGTNAYAIQDAGYCGHYWSSTVSSSENAVLFFYNSVSLRTDLSLGRYQDRSVRCLAK